MSRVISTRRLVVITGVSGLVFGAFAAGMTSLQSRDAPVWVPLVAAVIAAIVFGGSMFLVFYFGFVRPRQLDPGQAGFAERRVTASERVWGDGRPLPVWLRRSMYAAAPLFLVIALLNIGLMMSSGTVQPSQVGASLMFAGLAVLAVVNPTATSLQHLGLRPG